MGRRKQHDRGLPIRMRRKHRVFYYVSGEKWVRLSDNFAEALKLWQDFEGTRIVGSTVSHAIDRYLLEVLPTKAERTQADYQRHAVKVREVFGDCHLDSVRSSDIAMYLDRRSAKAQGNREVAMLSSVYSSAMRWGWVDVNPCRGVRRNTEKRRTRAITDVEIAKVRTAAGPQIQCIMDIVLLTALRKSDALKIRLADYSKDSGLRVEIGKTGQTVVYSWTESLDAAWERAKRLRRRVGSLYLFANRKGQQYTVSGFDSNWQRVIARAGVEDFRFHDLRAYALTKAEQQRGMDYARRLAVHSDTSTTARYVRSREPWIVDPLG